jgi:putative transposase
MFNTTHDRRPIRSLNVNGEGNLEALSIKIDNSIPATRVMKVLSQLLDTFDRRQAIRLGSGLELPVFAFADWAEAKGVNLKFIARGKRNLNRCDDRFIGRYREKELNARQFT